MTRFRDPEQESASCRPRKGVSVLEILVSLAVISIFGLATLGSLTQSWRSVQMAQASDRAFLRAVALLDAAMLWSREDLDRRLGDRRQGEFTMRIERVGPNEYTISVLDSSRVRVLLSTSSSRTNGDDL